MSTGRQLLELSYPYIQACIQKPFLIEACKGSLPVDKFKYYLKIDYQYLFNYNKILALGVFKSENLKIMEVMVRLLDGNIREMSLHEKYAAKYGVSINDLVGQKLGPTKYAYTRHELSVAHEGTLVDILATLLPCMWGYGEVACQLFGKYQPISRNPYYEWLNYYTSTEYKQLGEDCLDLIDTLSIGGSDHDLQRMIDNFLISFHFEVACWDAYYAMEEWKI